MRAQVPITPAATKVHGIRDVDLAEAPSLPEISRQLLAYNAPYDRRVLTHDLMSAGVNPQHLAERENWVCLMRARSVVDGHPWTALNGPHHALGDCLATLELLHSIAGWPA